MLGNIFVSPLPSPREIKNLFPLAPTHLSYIAQNRNTATRILEGKDPRKVIVVGPCSIHDKKSAIEYAKRFKELSLQVESHFFLVMRVYLEKPRTTTGWKGLLYDPYLDTGDDIETGLIWARELFTLLTDMQVPIATEFVDPIAAAYSEDLITWGFIGARTSSSQPHRQLASALNFPVGFKNATDGNIEEPIQAMIAAQAPHAFISVNEAGQLCKIKSPGNPSSHIVLRGSHQFPNYDEASIASVLSRLSEMDLPQKIMIDCAHGNCQKQYEKQSDVFLTAMEHIERGNQAIFGLMLESHLKEGNQPFGPLPSLDYAISVTDPCIDWPTTETLIYSACTSLSVST